MIQYDTINEPIIETTLEKIKKAQTAREKLDAINEAFDEINQSIQEVTTLTEELWENFQATILEIENILSAISLESTSLSLNLGGDNSLEEELKEVQLCDKDIEEFKIHIAALQWEGLNLRTDGELLDTDQEYEKSDQYKIEWDRLMKEAEELTKKENEITIYPNPCDNQVQLLIKPPILSHKGNEFTINVTETGETNIIQDKFDPFKDIPKENTTEGIPNMVAEIRDMPVFITSSLGQQIQITESFQFDASGNLKLDVNTANLSNGVYILTVPHFFNNKRNFYGKIVVQH